MVKIYKKHINIFWIILIFFSLLFSQSNIGRDGLALPFNVIVWTTVAFFIGFTLTRQAFIKQWIYNPLVLYLSIYILLVFSFSQINTSLSFEENVLYGLAFLGVIGFIYSSAQYEITLQQLKVVVEALILLAFLQALIGLFQLIDTKFWFYLNVFSYTPLTIAKGYPVGSFQQINMFATFMAFSWLLLAFWLVNFDDKKTIKLVLLIVLGAVFSYLIFISGSRAGALSLFVGALIVLYVVFKLKKNVLNLKFIVLLSTILIGYIISQIYNPGVADISKVLDKTERVLQGGDARIMLYSVGWMQFLESPFIGQGLGNYLDSFLQMDKGIGESSPLYEYSINGFVHPHNELLFWLINSGLIVLIGLFFVIRQFFKSFKDNTVFLFNISIIALIMPLLLQANLSYMFTLSSVHLFLLLFFIMVIVQNQNVTKLITSHLNVMKAVIPVVLISLSLAVYGAWHTLESTKEVVYFKDRKLFHFFETEDQKVNTVYLKYASESVVYKNDVKINFLNMVDEALAKEDLFEILQYIRWANSYPEQINDVRSVRALILSYFFINRFDLAKEVFKKHNNLLNNKDKIKFEKVISEKLITNK